MATILNTKHEIRNSKQFRMTKIPSEWMTLVSKFDHLDFGFVSDWSETDASPEVF